MFSNITHSIIFHSPTQAHRKIFIQNIFDFNVCLMEKIQCGFIAQLIMNMIKHSRFFIHHKFSQPFLCQKAKTLCQVANFSVSKRSRKISIQFCTLNFIFYWWKMIHKMCFGNALTHWTLSPIPCLGSQQIAIP